MKINKNNILALLLVIGCFTGLLVSFQFPMGLANMQDKYLYYKCLGEVDSAKVSHEAILQKWQKEGNENAALDQALDFILFEWGITKEVTVLQKAAIDFKANYSSQEKTKVWTAAFELVSTIYLEQSLDSQALEDIAKKERGSDALLFIYGELLQQQTEYIVIEQGIEKLHQQLENASDTLLAQPYLIEAYWKLGRMDKSVSLAESYQEALQQRSENTHQNLSALSLLGNKYAALGLGLSAQKSWSKAARLLRKITNEQAIFNPFQLLLAKSQFETGTTDAFDKYLRLKANRSNADWNLLLSKYLLEAGEVDTASALLKIIDWEASPNTRLAPEVKIQELAILVARGAYRELEATVQNLLQQDLGLEPKLKAYQYWAEAKLAQKKYKEVIELCNTALSQAPKTSCFSSISESIAALKTTHIKAAMFLYSQSQYNYSLKNIYNQAIGNWKFWKQRAVARGVFLNPRFLEEGALFVKQALDASWEMYTHFEDTSYMGTAWEVAADFQSFQRNYSKFNTQISSVSKEFSLLACSQLLLQDRREQEAIANDSIKRQHIDKCLTALKYKQETLLSSVKQVNYALFQRQFDSVDTRASVVQANLQDSSVMVSYFQTSDAIYQFLLTNNELVGRKIVWRTYVDFVTNYLNLLMHPRQDSIAKNARQFMRQSHEFYHKILHHELLNQSKRIIIIPHGLLEKVPFEPFVREIPENMEQITFLNLPYLVKTHQVSYAYTLRAWLQNNNQPNFSNAEILGMAATYVADEIVDFRVDWQQQSRKKLAARGIVINELDSLILKYEGEYYTDRYASEYYFNKYARRFGVLHLALLTAKDEDGELALVLAEDGEATEDNFLMATEVQQLGLNCEMVVLPYLGSNTNGHRLDYAFVQSGAKSVLSSLWVVQSEVTPQLLDGYYGHLKKGTSKDFALQQTKLQYLENASDLTAHPYYWASMIQFNNTNSIAIEEPVTHIWWFIIPIAFIGLLGWWSMQALRQRRG